MILNPSQKACVEHISGPLLIVAGAGTGKTRVITNRILHLIQEKGIPTSQILALTFTEKAANEMVERIDVAMPFGYEEILIKTFHGFCDKVLREKGLEIGIDPSYKIFTKTKAWMMMKKRFYELGLDYYMPTGGNAGFIDTLLNYFSRLKDEYILASEYKSFAEKKLAAATGGNDLEVEEAQKTMEIANAYEKYQEMLKSENAMDFNDLILNTIELFKKRKTVLNYYSDLYPYIMVDEFQDTNYSQTLLVLMLAEKHKNLVVVGDDDQSIYRWRGATLNNIDMFKKAFKSPKFISLTKNYRNNQDILDASYSLIQNNNPERMEFKEKISKKLESAAGKSARGSIEVWHFENYLHEVNEIVNYIQKAARDGGGGAGGGGGGTVYSDFTILGRTNNILKPFIEELRLRGIPYVARASQNILTSDEVRDLIAVLRILINKKDDTAVYRILQIPVFGIEMKDIFDFVNKVRETNEPYYDLLKDYFPVVHDLLEKLVLESRSASVSKILMKFLDMSGYLKFLSENHTNEAQRKINNIVSFSKIVAEFESEVSEKYIGFFLDYVDLLEESDIPNSEDISEEEEGVRVLTVHSAKGLEFKNVFIVSMVNRRFPAPSRNDQIEIPDALVKEPLPETDYHKEEERRLMYVACTRPKEKLILTYSDKYEGNRDWERSTFIDELIKGIKISEKKFELDPSINLKKPDYKEKIYASSKKLFAHLSHSQLNTFKECPLKYSYKYAMNLPTELSPATSFGNSVHSTLRDFYAHLMEDEKAPFDLLEKLFEKNWDSRGYQSKAHENSQYKRGLEILREYYEKNSKKWIIPAFIEKSFNIKVGPYMIKGRIDRIDKLSNGKYEIIDYKTGKSKRDENINKDLQLQIYSLACAEVHKLDVGGASWYFLDGNEKKSVKKIASTAEAREEIIKIIKEMENSDFAPTPGFHCKYCDYRIVCPAIKNP